MTVIASIWIFSGIRPGLISLKDFLFTCSSTNVRKEGSWEIPTPQRLRSHRDPRQWWLLQLNFVESIWPPRSKNVVIWDQAIPITKKIPEVFQLSPCTYIPTYYLRQPVPVEDFGKSDKKDDLNLIDVKWRRNVAKSTLKVHHKNMSEMEKAKYTMTALDMNWKFTDTDNLLGE